MLQKSLIFFNSPRPFFKLGIQVACPMLFTLFGGSKNFIVVIFEFIEFKGNFLPILLFILSKVKIIITKPIYKGVQIMAMSIFVQIA